MSDFLTPLSKDHPMLKAWEEYKQTEEFANTGHWAKFPDHTVGSLWAAFCVGWMMGTRQNIALLAIAKTLKAHEWKIPVDERVHLFLDDTIQQQEKYIAEWQNNQ